ncbi:adenylyltransferase/cytidyltransferase family protein [Candidatus Daviesbacteria bacterium]|nr:adenylyltransferase/cytidyltransferase family protein [Candidatus Daviesbacteria bacterium]
MAQVINVYDIPDILQKLKNEKVVLTGGCFDVLHLGHVIFLQQAQKAGDTLVVLLESDEKIKKLKGVNRPVHNQKERAKILAALKVVDYVVLLPSMETEEEYDALITQLKPDIIAVTKGADDYHHKRASKLVGARLKYVTGIIGDYSTTRILTQN